MAPWAEPRLRPSHSPMPASAFFKVGQLPDVYDRPDEVAVHAGAYVSAVDAFERRGLIDPARVGIIGWSRSGLLRPARYHFFPDRFAAAIVADPSSLGLFNYLMGHGWSPLLDQEYETFNEGMPVGEDLTRWLEIRCSASTAYARH